MSVGKRIYLKRVMPDPEIMKQFKAIPASNTADVMGRSCAMNPRIKLVSSPKAQMMVGPAYTVKCRAGDNLLLHAALITVMKVMYWLFLTKETTHVH